jgi:xanthine/CO dehydrogenase XdhC/CoxF family maturation factor
MGLDIGAADPPEIAVSVVAQLVAVLRREDAS